VALCDKQVEEIKQKILKTRELIGKMKDPGQASRAEELVNTLKQKCVTLIREKKEINDMLNNPN
jgi:hypothetical protein